MSPRKRLDPRWYQDAVFYELRVGAFYDSNGDGIGDFKGLIEKLDYLQDLGVDTLWLLPFYPSPGRDDGYDISDYMSVHPDYGTIQDFKAFLREAHRRGLRVVTELVLNHTSDQHAWFQRARHARPRSKERDFYVWSDTAKRYEDARIIFKDFETSNWTWDPVAKAYYWHRFYSHQPDLNFENPAVRKAVLEALDFWLEMGVDGLRLDAVPYLFEKEGSNCENLPETHAFLKEIRRHVDKNYGDRMLLAEANQWPEDSVAYFGQGDECHMAFHFPIMPRLFLASHTEDRFPIIDTLRHTPHIPESCQWALFLRNHDELTLEMVTDEERDLMYRAYAPSPRARINLGIRRRLAPLLGNNRRKIELLNALLLSLPGTPVIYYGDEIGMGDNIYLGDRNGVRTPMQWSADRNAGFSRGSSQRLALPVISESEYHYETLNVEAQHANPSSLLWWMKRIIALRRRHPALGRGALEFLYPRNPRALAFLRTLGDEKILVVFNLSRFVQYVELDLSAHAGLTPVELFGRNAFPAIGRTPYFLSLGPHAFYWFSLEPRRAEAGAGTAPAALAEIAVESERSSPFEGKALPGAESAVAAHLRRAPLLGARAGGVKRSLLVDALPVPGAARLHLTVWKVEFEDGASEEVSLPLGAAFGEEARQVRLADEASAVAVLSAQRPEPSTGVLYDAGKDPRLAAALLEMVRSRRSSKGRIGQILGVPHPSLRRLLPAGRDLAPACEARAGGAILLGGNVIARPRRRMAEGVDPEGEILQALAQASPKAPVPLTAGVVEFRRGTAAAAPLFILTEFVAHEGAAGTRVKDALRAFLETSLTGPADAAAKALASVADPLASGPGISMPEGVARRIGPFIETARLLGRRLSDLHRALAGCPGPDFTPEPFSTLYQRSLYQAGRTSLQRCLEEAKESLPHLQPPLRARLETVIALEEKAERTLRELTGARLSGARIRCHGDLDLGRILFTGRDFQFIGFDGDPARPSGERRLKRSPLRDVASLARSFQRLGRSALTDLVSRGVAPVDSAAAAAWTEVWVRGVLSAVLSGYYDGMEGSGLLPKSQNERTVLIRALLVERLVSDLAGALARNPEASEEPASCLAGLLA